MPSIDHAIEAIVERSRRGSMNESNTKVLLIEPMLEALGWDTRNLDSVTREYKVFDGTFLDYALQNDGRPLLFIEAKSWGSSLGDPKWIAQVVNYANNEGVVWCALTDGIVYRIYKTNEPVDMARKLVFEVDLRSYAEIEQRSTTLRYLALLARDAVLAGRLDSLGSRLFDEARIRKALEELFTQAPNRFVSLIRGQLREGERTLSPAEIRDVLKRVGKGLLPTAALPQSVTVAATVTDAPKPARSVKADPPPTGGRSGRRGEREYTFEEHFGDKPQVIVDLYTQLHERLLALDSQVQRVFRKQYVGYKIGKHVFCSVIPQKHRLRLVLPIPHDDVAGSARTRDVSNVGHWGIGQTEVSLDSEDQLDDTMVLVTKAVTGIRL